jgi:hypothetical protein
MHILRCLALLGAAGLIVELLPACPTTANISDVYMALDGGGNLRRNVFYTDTSEAHCIIEEGNGRSNLIVSVKIHAFFLYNFTTNKLDFVDQYPIVQEFTPAPSNGLNKLDVAISGKPKDDAGSDNDIKALPVGQYVCEAYLDGDLKGSAGFNIEFPECPEQSIVPKTPCQFFFEDKRRCPLGGLGSINPADCTCDYSKGGLWDCGP